MSTRYLTSRPAAVLLLLVPLLLQGACADADEGDSPAISGLVAGAPGAGGAATGSGPSEDANGAGPSLSGSSRAGSASSGSGGQGPGPAQSVSATPVELGLAGDYVILAKSGISTVPPSAVTGDIGVSPAAATYITGFSLVADATGTFSTSTQVTGKVYAADDGTPTPANMTRAVSDMEIAFADARGRNPDVSELGAGNIGGMTLTPGVYQWSSGLSIPTDVTLMGSASAVWIFQVAQELKLSRATSVRLTGGARSKNVFWQVSGHVDLETTSHFVGVILTQTAATLKTGASLDGRLLAQTAVTLDGNTLVEPAQ